MWQTVEVDSDDDEDDYGPDEPGIDKEYFSGGLRATSDGERLYLSGPEGLSN